MSGMISTLLVVGVIILGGWCFIAGPCKTMFANATGTPGLFGGTIFGSGIAQGRGQILTHPDGTKQVINPDVPIAGAKASVKANVSLPSGRSTGKRTTTSGSKLNATGSVSAGAGARYATSLFTTSRLAI